MYYLWAGTHFVKNALLGSLGNNKAAGSSQSFNHKPYQPLTTLQFKHHSVKAVQMYAREALQYFPGTRTESPAYILVLKLSSMKNPEIYI